MTRRPVVALLLVLLALAGCTSTHEGAMEGECAARLGLDGVVYRPHTDLDPDLPAGEPLGEARVVDCDGTELEEQVAVSAVADVDPSVAITVVSGDHRAVYVRDDLPESDWPPGLRRTSARPAT